MFFPVDIILQDARVLILGGGKVALRKCKKCLEQGAHVDVLSHQFLKEFYDLPVTILQGEYHKDMLPNYLFSIACTNDKLWNKQVIQDAIAQQCLCMGVHHEDGSNMKSMVGKEFEDFQMATSTKGNFPAITSYLANEAGTYLQDKEAKRLSLLREIRTLLSTDLTNPIRQDFCCFLVQANITILQQIKDILSHECVRILCYHGVATPQMLTTVTNFATRVQTKYPRDAICSAFLSHTVCKELNQTQHQIMELNAYLPFFQQLHKKIELYPMLFQKGHYYKEILSWNHYESIQVHPLPFEEKKSLLSLCKILQQTYCDYDQILVCYHTNSQDDFFENMQDMVSHFTNMHFIKETQLISNLTQNNIVIISLYMLAGAHFQWIRQEIQQAIQQGYKITYLEKSILEIEDIQNLILYNNR